MGDKVFRWLTQKCMPTTLQADLAERRPVALSLGDILKVLALAGTTVWGAAGLATKINSDSSAIKEHTAQIATLNSSMAEVKGEVHAMYQVIVPRRGSGRNSYP